LNNKEFNKKDFEKNLDLLIKEKQKEKLKKYFSKQNNTKLKEYFKNK
jgi:ribosomal protein S15P/S13E